jgi:tyrosine-protein kinase Etk/Wzc
MTSDDDEISLISIASALLKWRRAIIGFALVGAMIGAGTGLLSARKYMSSATFIPAAGNEQNASAGLALAASQFGIRVPSGGGGWPPSLYAELLSSRGLLAPIATDTLVVKELGNRRVAVMELFKIPDVPPLERIELTVRQLRLVVSATEDKKLGAVQLQVTTRWPSVSMLLTQRLIAGVNRFNMQTRQSQASAERQFVEGRAAEAERALRDAEDRLQAFLQRNRVAVSPELQFERDRLQRNITLLQQSYTSLLQSREEARIREVRDTPVITLLEPPILPAIGESRHTASKMVLGGILGVLIALVFKALGAARRSSDKGAREFFQTLEDAKPRLFRRRSPA